MFSLFASCYWIAFSHCERRIPCKQNMKWAYGIMGHSIGSIMGAMLDLVAMSSTEMSSKLVDGFPIKPIWNHLNLNLPFFLDFPSFIRFRASLNRFLSPSFFTHPPFQGTPGSLAGRRDQGSHLRFRRESPPVLRKLHGSSCSMATGHLQVFFPQFLRVFGVKTTKKWLCLLLYGWRNNQV